MVTTGYKMINIGSYVSLYFIQTLADGCNHNPNFLATSDTEIHVNSVRICQIWPFWSFFNKTTIKIMLPAWTVDNTMSVFSVSAEKSYRLILNRTTGTVLSLSFYCTDYCLGLRNLETVFSLSWFWSWSCTYCLCPVTNSSIRFNGDTSNFFLSSRRLQPQMVCRLNGHPKKDADNADDSN